MSRTNHPRPARPTGDEVSRVQNAAIGAADAFTRFEREFARLQRSLGEARRAGADDGDLSAAIRLGARGRADRAKALLAIFARIDAAHEYPLDRPEASS